MNLCPYGSSIAVRRYGVWVTVNGRMYSVFKGLNSGKWQVSVWDNYWRKNRKECVSTGSWLSDR